MTINRFKFALLCMTWVLPIVAASPAISSEKATQCAIVDVLHSEAHEPLELGELVISGDLDRSRVIQLMPLLLQSIGLSTKSEQEPDLPVTNEANIHIRGLKFNNRGTDLTSRITISDLAIQGLRIDADGQITIREVVAYGINSTTLQTMFYNAPHVFTSQLLIPVFRAQGVQGDGYNQVAGVNFRRWPLRFAADAIEASNYSYLERPLRRSSSGPQREACFILSHLRVEGLSSHALVDLKANGFQVRSNDLPNVTLDQMSLSGANWRSASYLLGQLAVRNSYIGRDLPAPTEMMSQLWPAGPFDIGLSGLNIQGLSVDYEAVSGQLDRFAFWTQKSAGGLFERFQVPRGSLIIKIVEEQTEGNRKSISGLVSRALELLKLEQFKLSWEAQGRFDSRSDVTRLDRIKLKLDRVAEFELNATVEGLENARTRLNASNAFRRAWTTVVSRSLNSNSLTVNRQDGNDADALPTTALREPSAQSGSQGATLGAIRVSSFQSSLTDLSGIDRISGAFVTVQRERGRIPPMDQRAARCHFAISTLETELSRPSSILAHYPVVLEGVVRWIKVGGKLQLIQTGPAQLRDFGRTGVDQPTSLRVRTAGLTPTTDCRR